MAQLLFYDCTTLYLWALAGDDLGKNG